MKTNEIEKLLRQLKDDPDFGALDNESNARLEARVFSFVDKQIAEQPVAPSGVFDFVTSLPGVLTDMVARPMALTSLLMVMVLGGWITSVNASLDTLPGDAFYGVKLASEKAQLVLASSNTKSKLHAEFASRRLSEIATLVQALDNDEETQVNVQTAVDGFNKQLDGVNAHLQGTTDQETVVKLARIIDQKSAELEEVLELVEDDTGSHSTIIDAIEVSEDVQEQAVVSLVSYFEESGNSKSRLELSRQFKGELQSIAAQTDSVTERLERIEGALESREDVEADLSDIKKMLLAQDLSESMDTAVKGGYERAFGLTTNIKHGLRDATEQLMLIEIQLTQSPAEEVVEVESQIKDSAVESPSEPEEAQPEPEVEHTE